MRFGYNTNGLAHHDLVAAVRLLGDLGYGSVAITIDHGALSPRDPHWRLQAAHVKSVLDAYGMRAVIETGGRFLLNPRVKHEPTLVSAQAGARLRRVEFYRHAIEVAQQLGSPVVSIWSGVARDQTDSATLWQRLIDGVCATADFAADRGITLGFEPEPGMFIDTMSGYDELISRLAHPGVKLTLDIGHIHCQGEGPIAELIARYADQLVNVHLEDMRQGIHEHLFFGEGEIDFAPVFAALRTANYGGGVHVELSRHSHDGANAAQRAMDFLQPFN